MALINCPECGKEVSEQAKICPNCGYKIKRMKSSVKLLVDIIILAVIAIAGYIFVDNLHLKPRNVSQQVYDAGVEMVNIADQVLKGKLTQSEASEKADRAYEKAESVEAESTDGKVADLSIRNGMIAVKIGIAGYYVSFIVEDAEQELRDARDELARDLNL